MELITTSRLTENQQRYIFANYNRMGVLEMGRNLSIPSDAVAVFLHKAKLKRHIYVLSAPGRAPKKIIHKDKKGMFTDAHFKTYNLHV